VEAHSLISRLSRRSFVRNLGAAALSAAAAPSLLHALQQQQPSQPPKEEKPDEFFSGESRADEGQSIIVETKSAYFKWTESEGTPMYSGYSVEDLTKVKVAPWKRLGIKGAMVNLSGDGGIVSAYVMELDPGQKTIPERHMFDERIICLSGSGESHVWQEGKPKVTAKWKRGTLFAMPLNAYHEHVFVVRTVEYSHLTLSRRVGMNPPEEIVVQVRLRRLLESDDGCALRVHGA